MDYRNPAFSTYEPFCAYCGFGIQEVLEVAHIDGNRQNNKIGNLIILCPTCHKMLDIDLISNQTIKSVRDRVKKVNWKKRMKEGGTDTKVAASGEKSGRIQKTQSCNAKNQSVMQIAILFLFQLALFLIGILGPWRDAPALKTNGRLARPVRMLLSFSLLVAAFAIGLGGAKLPTYAQWVAFGMLASFIGDVVMARLIPLPNRLIGGMIAFFIAHALYITAFVSSFVSSLVGSLAGWIVVLTALLFYCSLITFGWFRLVHNPKQDRLTNIGALVYLLWVGTMASFAFAVGNASGLWLAAIGGLLFVISDFIVVACEVGGKRIKNASDWIWLTYVSAQAGIIYAGGI
jgi:hypothetical protein